MRSWIKRFQAQDYLFYAFLVIALIIVPVLFGVLYCTTQPTTTENIAHIVGTVAVVDAAIAAFGTWGVSRVGAANGRIDAFLRDLTVEMAESRDTLTRWNRTNSYEKTGAFCKAQVRKERTRASAAFREQRVEARHCAFQLMWLLQRSSTLSSELGLVRKELREAVLFQLCLVADELVRFRQDSSMEERAEFRDSLSVAAESLRTISEIYKTRSQYAGRLEAVLDNIPDRR